MNINREIIFMVENVTVIIRDQRLNTTHLQIIGELDASFQFFSLFNVLGRCDKQFGNLHYSITENLTKRLHCCCFI